MRTVALLVLRILGVTAALSPADLGALEVDAVRLALTRHAPHTARAGTLQRAAITCISTRMPTRFQCCRRGCQSGAAPLALVLLSTCCGAATVQIAI